MRALLYLISFVLVAISAPTPVFAEELNCMLCHKHYGLARIDEKGRERISYINEELYTRSPHGRVSCNECHQDITEVPHKKIKPVSCTAECHMKEPSGNKKFSHKSVGDALEHSVHSPYDEEGGLKEHQEDYPGCQDCHEQPLFREFTMGAKSHEKLPKGVQRCKNCHTEGDFASEFYTHVSSRLQRQRNAVERINLCAECHANADFMERHDLSNVISTYKETFHFKMVSMGSEKTPDCIDCHSVSSVNGHDIKSQKDPESSVHEDNVGQTCASAGCHDNASEKLAGFKTHVTYEVDKYPLQHYLLLFFRVVMTVVLYGFLLIVLLELIRRLFPNVVIFKRKDKGRKAK